MPNDYIPTKEGTDCVLQASVLILQFVTGAYAVYPVSSSPRYAMEKPTSPLFLNSSFIPFSAALFKAVALFLGHNLYHPYRMELF